MAISTTCFITLARRCAKAGQSGSSAAEGNAMPEARLSLRRNSALPGASFGGTGPLHVSGLMRCLEHTSSRSPNASASISPSPSISASSLTRASGKPRAGAKAKQGASPAPCGSQPKRDDGATIFACGTRNPAPW
jgi:hypothetical protein